ncbi:MAG TPA: PLP-dependent aspartate aminotransferase family protein [Gammaproteobacteria bacterium]|jgi:cystathionine beta-lyase|nr:PLP-dependent aspartate aminotransferase family protein [Gammaproteobacteria bacterium]
MKRFTELVHFDPCPGDIYHANSTPIYQTATFAQESVDHFGQYDYSRSGNPTRSVGENLIAKLEYGKHGFLFSSGMAALNAVLGLLKCGDHFIAGDDLYGGTHRLLSERLTQRGIQFTLVDTTCLSSIENAYQANTRLVLVETPSNPLQKITDLKNLAEITQKKNILLVVDNTFLSPWGQNPLVLGADVVVHSATKHLAGHSDVTAGAVVVNNEILAKKIAFIQNAEGSALAPFESWLLVRGLKTLGLRIERQEQIALKIAQFLEAHSSIQKVFYPGLLQHPGHEIHKKQAKGFGSVISFVTDSLETSKKIISRVKLFKIAVSFGSLNSLISLPCYMSHASKPDSVNSIPPHLIRLSIGIEDADDLIEDLHQALNQSLSNRDNDFLVTNERQVASK